MNKIQSSLLHTLNVDLGLRTYPILVGSGLLHNLEYLKPYIQERNVMVVTNTTVQALYGEKLSQTLKNIGVDPLITVLPDGEKYKTWQQVEKIISAMLKQKIDRKSIVLAFGGGVVGDIAGFAAAIYQRGIDFIQMPTTLLAQVDSSVGGKTGINHPLGKNMIGAFHQPLLVLSDMDVLTTLSARELSAGLAEIIKHGLIADASYFDWVSNHIDQLRAFDINLLAQAVIGSCKIKANIVSRDEREAGPRALLNFGHTFGHAIETGMGYGVWLHGEAVAAGMVMAADLSARLGYIPPSLVMRIRQVVRAAGLPEIGPKLGVERYIELMQNDKKNAAGKIRFVLLKQYGEAIVTTVPELALKETLERCTQS